jgi:hypothetical protein
MLLLLLLVCCCLQCAARGPDHHIKDIELYLQCIFFIYFASQMLLMLPLFCLQCAARGPDHHINDIELYLQCIFTQLDLLQRWVQEQQAVFDKQAADAAAQAAAGGPVRLATLVACCAFSAARHDLLHACSSKG